MNWDDVVVWLFFVFVMLPQGLLANLFGRKSWLEESMEHYRGGY